MLLIGTKISKTRVREDIPIWDDISHEVAASEGNLQTSFIIYYYHLLNWDIIMANGKITEKKRAWLKSRSNLLESVRSSMAPGIDKSEFWQRISSLSLSDEFLHKYRQNKFNWYVILRYRTTPMKTIYRHSLAKYMIRDLCEQLDERYG